MTRKKRVSRMESLAAENFGRIERTKRQRVFAPGIAQDEIRRLGSREYGRSLRGCLDGAEVREVVSAARIKAWPHLNEEAVRLGSMSEFAERAAVLGADFRIAKMSWPSGLALFGFYLSKGPGLEKRPLICVNGAHHRGAIGTAFLHEVGHHLTANLFGARAEAAQMSLYTGYEAHLSDPRELAADIMVSLGIYPRDTAVRLLGIANRKRYETTDEHLNTATLTTALSYVGRRYGFGLDSLSTQKKLQYQAGLIHFTRLRQALLDEYDI